MARPIDLLPGQKFNKWTVESFAYKKGYDKYYNCVCECGNKGVVLSANLRRGLSKSCGCERHKQAFNYRDRTGERYNNLVCIRPEKRGEYIYWLCRCDCGKETWVRGINLTTNAVKSCGCIQGKANKVHGMSHTRIHGIWSHMIARCTNPSIPEYKYYGGRDIKVCNEWHGTKGFIRFMNWALENGYTEQLTIDRINVNGDYEPSNCRWATPLVQANNKRDNHTITYKGETHSIADWARIVKMPYSTLAQRINKLGWDIEKAMTKERRKIGVK